MGKQQKAEEGLNGRGAAISVFRGLPVCFSRDAGESTGGKTFSVESSTLQKEQLNNAKTQPTTRQTKFVIKQESPPQTKHKPTPPPHPPRSRGIQTNSQPQNSRILGGRGLELGGGRMTLFSCRQKKHKQPCLREAEEYSSGGWWNLNAKRKQTAQGARRSQKTQKAHP